MPEFLMPLVAYCALMSGTPGPNNVMLATSGANFGFRRTLPHMIGINAGVFSLTAIVCMGLGAVFTRYPMVHSVLKVAGSLYLVYLAWRLVGATVSDHAGTAKPLSFAEGAAFQLVNPKSWMKAATIATVFMPTDMNTVQAALLVSTIGWIVGFPMIALWTMFGVGIRRFLSSPKRLRIFNAVMGLSLLALAVRLML